MVRNVLIGGLCVLVLSGCTTTQPLPKAIELTQVALKEEKEASYQLVDTLNASKLLGREEFKIVSCAENQVNLITGNGKWLTLFQLDRFTETVTELDRFEMTSLLDSGVYKDTLYLYGFDEIGGQSYLVLMNADTHEELFRIKVHSDSKAVMFDHYVAYTLKTEQGTSLFVYSLEDKEMIELAEFIDEEVLCLGGKAMYLTIQTSKTENLQKVYTVYQYNLFKQAQTSWVWPQECSMIGGDSEQLFTSAQGSSQGGRMITVDNWEYVSLPGDDGLIQVDRNVQDEVFLLGNHGLYLMSSNKVTQLDSLSSPQDGVCYDGGYAVAERGNVYFYELEMTSRKRFKDYSKWLYSGEVESSLSYLAETESTLFYLESVYEGYDPVHNYTLWKYNKHQDAYTALGEFLGSYVHVEKAGDRLSLVSGGEVLFEDLK